MNIIGIDLGTATTGWGVLCQEKGEVTTLGFGAILTEKNTPFAERLLTIFQAVQKLIDKYDIAEMSVEQVFFNTNQKTALTVSQAGGVIKLAAALKKLPVYEYTPLQVKIALTGYGRAEKLQVGKMVVKILKLKTMPKPDDTSDALAVAVCHLFSRKVGRAV